jgi:hypothetical protein
VTALDFLLLGVEIHCSGAGLTVTGPEGDEQTLVRLRAEVSRRAALVTDLPAGRLAYGKCETCDDPMVDYRCGMCELCVAARWKLLVERGVIRVE